MIHRSAAADYVARRSWRRGREGSDPRPEVLVQLHHRDTAEPDQLCGRGGLAGFATAQHNHSFYLFRITHPGGSGRHPGSRFGGQPDGPQTMKPTIPELVRDRDSALGRCARPVGQRLVDHSPTCRRESCLFERTSDHAALRARSGVKIDSARSVGVAPAVGRVAQPKISIVCVSGKVVLRLWPQAICFVGVLVEYRFIRRRTGRRRRTAGIRRRDGCRIRPGDRRRRTGSTGWRPRIRILRRALVSMCPGLGRGRRPRSSAPRSSGCAEIWTGWGASVADLERRRDELQEQVAEISARDRGTC